MNLFYLLGLCLYCIFEGITEAHVWHKDEVDDAKYHFYRIMEMFGIAIMLVAAYLMAVNPGNLVMIAVGSVLGGFSLYRLAFVLASGQGLSYYSPPWRWIIYIPFIRKEISLYYPPWWMLFILGIIGFALIILG